jgi:hypothetical protein
MPTTYEPIATTTLGSTATEIVFSSIPATYTDLRLVIVGLPTTSVDGLIRFNADTTSNYSFTRISGNGTSSTSALGNNQTRIPVSGTVGWPTANPSFFTLDLFSYASATTTKACLLTSSMDQNGSGGTEAWAGLYRGTSAITSVTFLVATSSIAAGTRATLYGIEAA